MTDGEIQEKFRRLSLNTLDRVQTEKIIEKVYDLVKFVVHADRRVSTEEGLIMEEISGAVSADLSDLDEHHDRVEVLIVPQSQAHREKIQEQFSAPALEARAGGEAYVAGTYFSESFAQAICDRFRKRNFFSTVERQLPNGGEA